jgi:hypothetical protein
MPILWLAIGEFAGINFCLGFLFVQVFGSVLMFNLFTTHLLVKVKMLPVVLDGVKT